jgi:hypothetical protein
MAAGPAPQGISTPPNVHASRPSRTSSSSSLSQANATLQQRRTTITDALASDQNNLRRRLASERRHRPRHSPLRRRESTDMYRSTVIENDV